MPHQRTKKKTVVFVGAGASRACGYPVTGDILPRILQALEDGEFASRGKLSDEHIGVNARALLRILRQVVPKSTGTYVPQITEVLSILDYCIDSGEELYPVSRKTLKLVDARWLLERAISRVIRRIHRDHDVVPRDILAWIRRVERAGGEITIISTNYDFSLDRILFDDMDNWNTDYLKTDFGFTWRDPDDGALVHPSANPILRLYKLHGSLNWLGCSRCGNIYVNFMRTLVTLADGTGEWSECDCGYKPLRGVLVAPSFVRRYRDRNLLSVWRSAAESLRLADDWVFVGYSLPAEDIGIRALLLRSLLSRDRHPRTLVVSMGNDALPRYRQLLPACLYTEDGLRKFLDKECNWQFPRTKKPPPGWRRGRAHVLV
jgi:NAD-dependent SIR2 family protein deacetylase